MLLKQSMWGLECVLLLRGVADFKTLLLDNLKSVFWKKEKHKKDSSWSPSSNAPGLEENVCLLLRLTPLVGSALMKQVEVDHLSLEHTH